MTTYHLTCSSYHRNEDGTYASYEETIKSTSIDLVLNWLKSIENSGRYDEYFINMFEVTPTDLKTTLKYNVDHAIMKVEVEKNVSTINISDIFPCGYNIAWFKINRKD
ncbi:MAG: hypothetical protein [Wendovervirus sonii]|uniref:Uncharacterized protein n=1 Tax=phage Lak_Megaphage_Sonny TaxID=3109229 RepID=A0ABZ0Z3T0_9CAUD|nr:MAG: hypothetical protein [phage Lak_Megaphage_Sonny]